MKRRRRAPESTIARLAREVAGGSDAGALLRDRFEIAHATLQVESGETNDCTGADW